ncbi:hypothetical protein GDO81_029972 [Engystomops pustulosus]|uniref:Uncharacterized protein n=1 Tax=Engystomops pustulosus TaxID=76066 RepID=A0AAV6ZKG8_ENGPU|nr:hypothetical protein GDO81_029972 [Engystomops pustulosus]
MSVLPKTFLLEVSLYTCPCPWCGHYSASLSVAPPVSSRHRHQSDHECEKLEAPKQRMFATQQLVKEIVDSKKSAPPNKVRRGAKNAETAAKVALMKLKLHALGDKSLPQVRRRTYDFMFFLFGSVHSSFH